MFKNKNTLKGFLSIATFIIALLILVFMSAPAIKLGEKTTYTCLEIVKGYAYRGINVTGFSFPNLIPYLLLIILLVFEFLKYAIDKLNNRITRICMSVGFVIVGVMFILGKYMVNSLNGGAINTINKEIGWGAVIQIIVAFICAILCAIDAIVEFEPEIEDNSNEETKNEIEDLKATYIEEMKKINNKNDDEQ